MCFSIAGIANFLIWLVVLCAVIGILKILVPWILSLAGVGVSPPIAQIINILIIAIVIIAVIVVALAIIECAVGGGFGLRLLR